jgi:hypothetical protein
VESPELLRDGTLRANTKQGNKLAHLPGAVARKPLGVIYHTLKNNWLFEDFPNIVLTCWKQAKT